MKPIRLFLLLSLWLACVELTSAQTPLDVPDIEYTNDLSELRSLRRVFVHSAPDPLSREAILKELSRERGLLEVVERPEEADYYLVFYGPMGEGADSLVPSAGTSNITVSGTLVAFRRVRTESGYRPRQLFITRKSKTFRQFTLPFTSVVGNGFAHRPRSAKGARTELVLRLGLFLLHKKYPNFLTFDQFTNSAVISFSRKAEVQATREFLKLLKKVPDERPTGIGAVLVTPQLTDQMPVGLSFESNHHERSACPLHHNADLRACNCRHTGKTTTNSKIYTEGSLNRSRRSSLRLKSRARKRSGRL